MNEKIIVSVRYTAEDFARASGYIQRRSFLVKYVYLAPLAGVFGILLIFFVRDPKKTIDVFSRPQGFMPFVIAFILVIPIFYFLNRRKYSFLVKKQFERQIDSSPALQSEKTIVIDEDGMLGHSTLGGGQVDWEAFIEATESDEDFYFFTAKRMAQFVPKRAFESEAQQNHLRELVKRKLGDKAKF